MQGAALFAEDSAFTIVLRHSSHHHGDKDDSQSFHHNISTAGHAYRIAFLGASPTVSTQGRDIDADGGYDNYFLGNDPSHWHTHLPHYWTLFYTGLYPGIDMDVQVAQGALKTNFYLAPGANPSDIAMRYFGADKLYLSSGNLIVRTSVGEVVELQPYAYQETDTGRIDIEARYRLRDSTITFILGDYDTSLALVIDPILHFSTYTGSIADNWGTTATYDSYKNTYTAGLVFGIDYHASLGAFDTSYNGNADIGIFKFDPTGSQRLFATYLGGTNADMPHSLFVNAFDELVLFGTTGSQNFPTTPGAYRTFLTGGTALQFEGSSTINFPNGSDIFVSRFSSDGTQLQASTYIGGSGNDGLNYRQSFNNSNITIMEGNDTLYYNYGDGARGELITDDLNNIYVGTTTFSTDFPTTSGSVQPTAPSSRQNGVVFKIDYNLRNLIWSTYIGGSGANAVYSIDVDTSYNLLICGGTTSSDFPTTVGAFQTSYGGGTADGFVSKIAYNGDQLLASSYLGSDAYDQLYFVRSGRHNEVFLFGQTRASGSTMIYNAGYSVPGSGMLLARMYPDLSGREWSTVFGTPLGRPNLSPTAFAADICNRVYAAGWGRDFVGYNNLQWRTAGTTGMETTSDAYSDTTDGQDFYIMSLAADASQLDYATFFGEVHGLNGGGGKDHVDGGTSRFDRLATLYQSVCASCGGYDGFPTTTTAWSNHNNSYNCNNALFRINIHDDFAVAEFVAPPVGCAPYLVDFHNTGRGTSFLWDFGDGTTSTERDPLHTFTAPGSYTVRLIASIANGCRISDTTQLTVLVLGEQGRRITTQASCDGSPIQIGPQPMLGCTYRWITPGVSDSTIANPYVHHSGTYILRIEGNEGCFEVDTFIISYIDLLDTLIVTNPTCPGDSNGSVVAIVPAHLQDSALYFWDGIPGTNSLTGLRADGTTHTLLITSHGCSIQRQFIIQDPPKLVLDITQQNILCTDECDAWVRINYKLPDYPVGDTLFSNLCEGDYTFTVFDTAGCPYTASTIVIRDTNLLRCRIWADDTVFFLSESVQLHATRIPGASYSWNDHSTLNRDDIPDPIATPTDTISVYSVNITDTLGCTWYGSLMLHCTEVICGRPNVFIPNVFSPNDDGINDKLCFRGNFILDFYLAVYNRWGECMFETHDINDCWDGRYNGNLCMPGVYTFLCRIKCEAGFSNLIKGDITLIR